MVDCNIKKKLRQLCGTKPEKVRRSVTFLVLHSDFVFFASDYFNFSFCLYFSLFFSHFSLYTFSGLSVIASHAGQISARVWGTKQEMIRAHVGSQ